MSASGSGARQAPASVAQRLLWLLEQFRGEYGAANCPILLRLRGDLDEDRLTAGLDRLTARHESLRSTFTGRGRRLTQVVNEPRPVELRRVDLGAGQGARPADDVLREAVLAEVRQPIDTADWPARQTLWRLGTGDHALCLNLHHLVTDGWSCGLLLRDLDLLTRRPAVSPPPVMWQYPTFAEWQQGWLEGPASQPHRDYWRRQLAGARVPDIPLKQRAAPAEKGVVPASLDSGSLKATLDAPTVAALARLARAHRTTLPAVMLTIYDLVLQRAAGQDDLAVASFLSNRSRPEVRDTTGLVANMVVLRTRLPGAAATGEHPDPAAFAGAIRAVHATVMDAFVHQAVPYQLLPANTMAAGQRRPDDVMFQMVPQPAAAPTIAGADAEIVVVDALGTRFECELQLYPLGGGLQAVLFYNRARLDDGWAGALLDGYVGLARRLAADVPG